MTSDSAEVVSRILRELAGGQVEVEVEASNGTLRAIARREGLSASAVAGGLRRLTRAGLVEKVREGSPGKPTLYRLHTL